MFPATITSGSALAKLDPGLMAWLVEVRVEMELSKPTKYALRFEDDICNGSFAVQGAKPLQQNALIGIFVRNEDENAECLVYGPVTEVKSSNALGGPGSWVEIHGQDRRVEMGRAGVNAQYTGKASEAAQGIISAYGFTPDVQETLITYDQKKKQLSQRATDLAFLEEIARKNNMELWFTYEVEQPFPLGDPKITETLKLQTSPKRDQGGAGALPKLPILTAAPANRLAVNPPREECPGVNKFEVKIDYEKPTSAKGFTYDASGDKAVVEQIVQAAEPVDPVRPVPVEGPNVTKREAIIPPQVDPEEAFLAKEAIVFEQSWFVEVDASTTRDQANFVIRPHAIVEFSHLDARLAGSYQVTQAVHVITASDHFTDFKAHANGLGGAS